MRFIFHKIIHNVVASAVLLPSYSHPSFRTRCVRSCTEDGERLRDLSGDRKVLTLRASDFAFDRSPLQSRSRALAVYVLGDLAQFFRRL